MKKDPQLMQDYVCSGDIEGVRSLLKNNPSLMNIGSGDNSPLILAAGCGSKEIVKLLLEAGADVNYSNATGETALASACFNGDVSVVKLLLERGADIWQIDRFGVSIFDNASDHPELVSFLDDYRQRK